ncbi:MAG: endolytic transglycosylase MltG [Candidatus Peribacteraceae bacterium]|nr:endolytic transglycosylase MltG [Candidatus Peribacteraceae bacterium]
MKLLRNIAITIVAVLILSFVWYKHALSPVDASDDVRSIIEIPKGSSVAAIADILEEQGIIRSSSAFSLYARRHGQTASMKAGSFVLRPSMGVPAVVETLTKGTATEASVTIPEGYAVSDIDALLAEKGITKAGEIAACARTCDFASFTFLPADVKNLASRGGKLEGYLFPDTYFVLENEFVPKFFLERLLGTFRTRVVEGLAEDIRASGRPLHEIVAMASLVEEESRKGEERNVVAGILWKRLEAGMGLGVDAAVRYAVNKPRAAITKTDLDLDSPYNLRKYRGLPPGPIANPSLESIKAALHPKATEYWYYLHDDNGQIHYAVTNDEHNRNRALYLQ